MVELRGKVDYYSHTLKIAVGDVLPYLPMGRIEEIFPQILQQFKSLVSLTVTKNRELINIIDGDDQAFMETVKGKAQDISQILSIHASSTYAFIFAKAEKIKDILCKTVCLESCLDCAQLPRQTPVIIHWMDFCSKNNRNGCFVSSLADVCFELINSTLQENLSVIEGYAKFLAP